MRFFVGLHHPNHAAHFDRCMVSVRRIAERRSDIPASEWIMDSGAFTEVARHGGYRDGVDAYARQIERWAACGELVAAVAQDYMCEPFVLAVTGLGLGEHQRLTVERYDALTALRPNAYVMPVIQGYLPEQYAAHVRDYGERLTPGMWVGVGSVCKRNGSPDKIAAALGAIKAARPDLRLHGFGVKLTALNDPRVRAVLWSADSMAWSFAARRNGGDANDWREAKAYVDRVEAAWAGPRQLGLNV